MSTHALAWEHFPARGNHLLVLLALADTADDNAISRARVPHLCKRCRLSGTEVHQILLNAEISGWLRRIPDEDPSTYVTYELIGPEPAFREGFSSFPLVSLYTLAFKDEPLIKVGISSNLKKRSAQLGTGRFDLSRSLLVTANNGKPIRILEDQIKTKFHAHARVAQIPLASGNSEVFCSSALPDVLQLVDRFHGWFPEASLSVQEVTP